ncbi:hypothetical protein SAMN06265379_101436 [Saccharicrinis carchari]|uniref:DUF4843 domain-containing protein n=1 Tax=Saccharicrinis carchari TaxID=1168039 RepID=A0A521AVR4_SACCC|nr:hypothetical protein [Saccharicrinis carchari]SMO38942.1 hypothetical protein SAMN06265379_101436 [Saccharicrinis carchari]
MKNIVIVLFALWVFASCENPYENVSEEKYYKGYPFVSLSSEQSAVRLGVHESTNQTMQAGVFKDSLVLSSTINEDLVVYLEMVDEETQGVLNDNFTFQEKVTIRAGHNYGSFTVSALNLPQDEVSKFKLTIRIKEVDKEQVIAGLYGIKKENEARQKRFKTYSFQK